MAKYAKKSAAKKLTALFLAVVLLCGSFICPPVAVHSNSVSSPSEILSENVTGAYVMLDGEQVQTILLPEDAKLRLEAAYDGQVSAYQWQIRDPENENRWFDISGGFSNYQWVTHALVGSMLNAENIAYLRCRMLTQNEYVFTEPVQVTVSLRVDFPQPEPQKPVMMRSAGITRAAEQEHKTYSIVINYLFDNNAIAFEPYGASVAAGSDFKATITSPTVVGYAPFRRDGENYIDASVVELDLTDIRENITINVIYEPALVEYAIHHHLQNILDDEYSVHYDLITVGKALTGSVVGEGLALTEEQLPGFKALAYEKLTVAADGSTVIEIRYDRNYYLTDFDMNGGYGTEPVYTRYGTTVGANTPIRHGYVFDGWELVSYGGHTPTTEQQAKYALQPGSTIEVPAANLRYRARWITQETTYTVVFWRENADDNGYTYWGHLDDQAAMSGSYVDARDCVNLVSEIDDEAYFTFNPQKSDKHVLVEGDGSTVVNVYYTRNFYKLTFKASGNSCTILTGHTHSDACYDIICGLGHTHTAECQPTLECTTPAHSAHNADCIICGKAAHTHGAADCDCNKAEHTHTTKCWNNIGSVTVLNNAPSGKEEGYIFRSGSRYYIYIAGQWYRYNGKGASSGDIVDPTCKLAAHTHGTDCACDKENHTHTDRCYRDILHTHIDLCYSYSCGADEHIHSSNCKRLKCPIPEKHTHTSSCNNTVKVVYAKYEQSLKDMWPITDDKGNIYNRGERWKPSSSSYYTQVLVYIAQMPPDDFTLTLDEANYPTITMNYYLQVLPGEANQVQCVQYNNKYYKLDNTIKANYNYVTKAEDFFDIHGFNQSASDPAFDRNDQIDSSTTVNFYYDRITDHYLWFNNNGTVLDNKTEHGIMYGAPLTSYNFVPDYPENLEPNAYTFGGWYTSPGCYAGTEVNWNTLTMPEGNLLLYAKWVPITHTVRVFKDASMTEQVAAPQIVDHKSFAHAPEGTITNGNYVFQGWFYKDEVNGVIEEKAFVFTGIPVVEDLDIYAKWSSHVTVQYKINYKLHNTDIDIADPTVGNAIAGHNKTFDAKAGDQLYTAYQTGFYPLVNSHTITMSVDGTHEFTFYYVYVESMPYKVRYVDEATGKTLFEDKVVMDNTYSVVTETFVRYDKKMPDAYQKRLVLSADTTDKDNDKIYDANVITFYYNDDEEHAYYRVVHYIQNISGNGYREYRSEETVGTIGNTYTVNALTFTGFVYQPGKTVVNDTATPSTGTTVTTQLGADGALIELYYDRQPYNYTVHYIDSRTDTPLHPHKTGSGLFGEQGVEYAVNLEHLGYELVSDNAKTYTISANEDLNVVEFLYQEKNVTLKYQIIGPAGCGALSQESENLIAISGTTNGSMPFVNNGFIFLGWYTDVDCTNPAPADWVDSTTNRLIPQKTGAIWTATTYYAKFAALETDLTLTTKLTDSWDENQAFLFRVQGKAGTDTAGIDLTVTVVGNSSTTITKLPVGDYTITELTDWSWRYENGSAVREVTLEYHGGSNEIVFMNNREHIQWLDGNAIKDNRF